MTQPVTAIAAIGAAAPPMDARALAPAPTDPALAALHDAAAARDFAAQVGPFSTTSAPRPSSVLPVQQSIADALKQGSEEMKREFGVADVGAASSPMEAAERFARLSEYHTQMTARITAIQIEYSIGLGISSTLIDTTHSLLKSNE